MTSINGTRFGSWLVLGRAAPQNGRRGWVHVRCTCGTDAIVALANLRAGKSRSCGHWRPSVRRSG